MNAYLDWSVAELEELGELIPAEAKQYILDILWEGLTVGEVCEGTNIPTFTMAGLVISFHDHMDILRRTI